MATDVRSTLRKALTDLRSEKLRVDKQISAIETALRALDGQRQTSRAPGRRRAMSAAARKAIGIRMKAYWAKRRAGTKGKAAGGGKTARG